MKGSFPMAPEQLVPTFQQLQRRSTPQSGNVPEIIPHWAYDTQTYTDNTTTELTFFAAAQANRSLGNLGTGGAFPSPQYMTIYGIHCDIFPTSATAFVSTAASGAGGALNDMGQLVLLGLPRMTLRIASKDYGPWPLSVFQSTGGPTGFGWGNAADASPELLQYALNGVPGVAGEINGFITIQPNVDFSVIINWNTACNTAGGDYRIRITLKGLLGREVR